eukprot:TRINITY_DN14191_c0_g1_i1.p1 TRINITY_DN14191_c0_g1~~TRINITY_DN14191_c0_g1_i1.p1  ORF type:complete len:354 (+),score=95.83 TRINITY_DN14191_c0_g1_i1:46-1062(+)
MVVISRPRGGSVAGPQSRAPGTFVPASVERRWLRQTLGRGWDLQNCTVEAFGEEHRCVCVVDRFGRSPLHVAVDYGWAQAVATMLRFGADASVADHRGMTALHCAAAGACFDTPESRDVMRSLYAAAPTTLSATDEAGRTPLHLAALWRRGFTTTLLLELGADPLTPDSSGKSAVDHAEARPSEQAVLALNRSMRAHTGAVSLCLVCAAVVAKAGEDLRARLSFDSTPRGLVKRAAELMRREQRRREMSVSVARQGSVKQAPQSVRWLATPAATAHGETQQAPAATSPGSAETPTGEGSRFARAVAAATLRPKNALGQELLVVARQMQRRQRQSLDTS